jgi:signal transduction histidine kinase
MMCFSPAVLAQAPNNRTADTGDIYVDSLLLVLHNAGTDQERADVYYSLSWHWGFTDTVKAMEALQKAGQLVNRHDLMDEAKYLFHHAGVFYNHDKEKSQRLYMEAEALFSEIETPESYDYRAMLWSNYATLEQAAGNDNAYLQIKLDKCIPLAKKAGSIGKLSSYYTDLGLVFFNLQEYEKSAAYCQQAIDLLNEHEIQDWNLLWAYLNLAHTRLMQKEMEKAEAMLEKAEELLQPVFEREGKYTSYPFYHLLQSLYHESAGEFDKAIEHARKGIEYAEQYRLGYHRFRLMYYLAHYYEKIGRNEESKEILTTIKETDGYLKMIENQGVVLNKLAEVEASMGNHEAAYQTMRELQAVNDSIYANNIKLQLTEMEARYNASENERRIMELENHGRMQKTILFSSGSFAVLIFLFLLYAINQRKKRAQQKLIAVEQRQAMKISTALMEGQENERARVARELHDGLGGKLTGIKLNIENCARDNNDKRLHQTAQQLTEAVADIRNLSHNLMPPSIRKYGLEEAIKDFIQNLETPDTKMEYYASNMAALDHVNKQLSVFRIVQELVNNAIKHARASRILLQTTIEGNLLLIDIEDDGIGFDPRTVERNMGLNNIETRVQFLNGTMQIDSQPGKGTAINIECRI